MQVHTAILDGTCMTLAESFEFMDTAVLDRCRANPHKSMSEFHGTRVNPRNKKSHDVVVQMFAQAHSIY